MLFAIQNKVPNIDRRELYDIFYRKWNGKNDNVSLKDDIGHIVTPKIGGELDELLGKFIAVQDGRAFNNFMVGLIRLFVDNR